MQSTLSSYGGSLLGVRKDAMICSWPYPIVLEWSFCLKYGLKARSWGISSVERVIVFSDLPSDFGTSLTFNVLLKPGLALYGRGAGRSRRIDSSKKHVNLLREHSAD